MLDHSKNVKTSNHSFTKKMLMISFLNFKNCLSDPTGTLSKFKCTKSNNIIESQVLNND